MRTRPVLSPATGRPGPVRTCVGCRRRAEAVTLIRVVAEPATGRDVPVRLVVDSARRLPGRGAWVHPDPACVDRAITRRAFPRALRLTGAVDPDAVARHVGSARTTGSTTAELSTVESAGPRAMNPR